jgi:hypothetical protein
MKFFNARYVIFRQCVQSWPHCSGICYNDVDERNSRLDLPGDCCQAVFGSNVSLDWDDGFVDLKNILSQWPGCCTRTRHCGIINRIWEFNSYRIWSSFLDLLKTSSNYMYFSREVDVQGLGHHGADSYLMLEVEIPSVFCNCYCSTPLLLQISYLWHWKALTPRGLTWSNYMTHDKLTSPFWSSRWKQYTQGKF